MSDLLLNTVVNGLPPAAPVPTTAATGGTVLAGVYGVELTYVTAGGETVASVNGPVTTSGTTSTITIPSPASVPAATGWYAYVTQVGGSTFTRQQGSGSPTAIGTVLTLTAPPSSSGAVAPSANQTGATQDFGAGNTMVRVAALMTCDPGVTAATVTVNGSADASTFVPLLTFTNGLRCSAAWFNAASTYRAFNAVLTNYAGTGGVYLRAGFRGGAAASSAGGSIGMF